MRGRFARRVVLPALIAVCATASGGCASAPGRPPLAFSQSDRELVSRIDASLATGTRFLVSTQSDDGAWRSKVYGPYKDGPTLTPYVMTALHVAATDRASRESFERGRGYLRGLLGPHLQVPPLASPVYTAAPATWLFKTPVLTSLDMPRELAWVRYLREQQLASANGWNKDDPEFGGFGYSPATPKKPAPGEFRAPVLGSNLSATVYALGALRLSGVPSNDPVYADILTFVGRCHNFSDDPATSDPNFDDGGFFFTPTDAARNKAGAAGTDRFGRTRFHSYGAMTADGLRALLHAGLPTDHPRVVAARRWLERNFRADANPGVFEPDREVIRNATYYYYCWSVAHAFMHLNVRKIQTEAGEVDWPVAIAEELVNRQSADGTWTNRFTDSREDDPLVATPAAMAALAICRHMITGVKPADHITSR
jgi:hypothetical protein